MMKRFLFLTVLALFVSTLANFAFAAGPAKMFWLKPLMGNEVNSLALKMDSADLDVTSCNVVLTLTSESFKAIDLGNVTVQSPAGSIITVHTSLDNGVITIHAASASTDTFVATTLLTINLNNPSCKDAIIVAAFQLAEINGGSSEWAMGGLNVIDRAVGGVIYFEPVQIGLKTSTLGLDEYHATVGQKVIFMVTGGVSPYKWEVTLTSPVPITTYRQINITDDAATMEIIPPDWTKYEVEYLVFNVELVDAVGNKTSARLIFKTLPGDVDMDGSVMAKDAQLILRSIVDPSSPLGIPQVEAADVSGNGNVTTADAMLILQLCVGLIAEFPRTGDGIGAPPRQPLAFSQQIKELKEKGVDSETIALLTLAKQQEAKSKQPTTWGKIKS